MAHKREYPQNRIFLVKLSHWTSPTEISATSRYEAKKKALKRYPVCDCGCDEYTTVTNTTDVTERLAYLRREIYAERISLEEIAELQSLSKYIAPNDTELLSWAGVRED